MQSVREQHLRSHTDNTFVESSPVFSSPSPEIAILKEDTEFDKSRNDRKAASSRWLRVEEILLSGCVLDVYYRNHSLRASRSQKKGTVWKRIEEMYNTARERLFTITGQDLPPRTMYSLQKRWKQSGEMGKVNGANTPSVTREYVNLWDVYYNIDNRLLCSKEKFQKYLKEANDLVPLHAVETILDTETCAPNNF